MGQSSPKDSMRSRIRSGAGRDTGGTRSTIRPSVDLGTDWTLPAGSALVFASEAVA
jgi:hypothetical protein